DSAKGYYPASRNFWNDATYKTNPNSPQTWATGTGHILTWVHEVMPYIERQDMRAQVENALAAGVKIGPAANQTKLVGNAAYGRMAIVLCPIDEPDDATTSTIVNPQYSHLS